MAVSIGVLFAPTQIGTTATTVFTMASSPSTLTLLNGRLRFTNTSGASVSVTWYVVPSAGTPGAANCQGNAEAVAQNTHVDLDIPLLGPGYTIQALASSASAITVSGIAGILSS